MSIDEILSWTKRENEAPDSYVFLPEIANSLMEISENAESDLAKRKHLARGLERRVLEDVRFADSELGLALLKLSDDFVRGDLGT